MASKTCCGFIALRPAPGLRCYWRPRSRTARDGISGATRSQNKSDTSQDPARAILIFQGKWTFWMPSRYSMYGDVLTQAAPPT